MTQDIENCPFCSDAHLHISHLRLTFFVVCQHCNGSGPRRRRIEDAVDQWNRLSRALAVASSEKDGNKKGRTVPA